jgi:hypothetical protein
MTRKVNSQILFDTNYLLRSIGMLYAILDGSQFDGILFLIDQSSALMRGGNTCG